METSKLQPLVRARKVLSPELIQTIIQDTNFGWWDWNILDRWALQDPEKLAALEAEGEIIFFDRFIKQSVVEKKILVTYYKYGSYLSEIDVLIEAEINLSL